MRIDICYKNEEKDDKDLRSYNIPNISMIDFNGWNNCAEMKYPLECFIEAVKELTLTSDNTEEGGVRDPNYVEITPLVPKHIQDIFKGREDSSEILAVNLDKKLQMLKIAEEICHDYLPNENYVLRIHE
jgi:hypothetical protein